MEYLNEALLHYEGWHRPKDFSQLTDTVAYELKPTDTFTTFIKRKKFNKIIDCGCGANELKQVFKDKVVSFDVRDIPGVDYVGTFQEVENKIEKQSADFIVCYGSVSFGKREYIEDCIRIVSEWCMPGCIVLMVTKTNFEHKPKTHNLEYKWSIEDIFEWGDKYSFNIRTPILPVILKDSGEYKTSRIRFQWLWQKI